MPQLIAISGGIGSGKSMVSRVVMALGYPVYDCDAQARAIMDNDPKIIRQIADLCPLSVKDGKIMRPVLSAHVFSNPRALEQLNAIVHGAVRCDLMRWQERQTSSRAFVETAIIYQSGIDLMVDEVWEVTAPEPLRIERVERRSHLTPSQAKARIEAQESYKAPRRHKFTHRVVNDGITPILPRIEHLLRVKTR